MTFADLRIMDPLKAHKDDVTCLQTLRTQNCDALFSCSKDKKIYFWDLNSTVESEFGKLLKEYAGKHTRKVNAIAVSSNMLVSVGSDAKGYIWDINTKKDVAVLDGHHRDIFCVCINKEDNKIVTGGADNTIILWNTKGQLISTFGPRFDKAHKNWVTCCAFHPANENILFSGSKDGTIKMWDVENNSLLATFIDGNILDYSKCEEEKVTPKDHDLALSVTCLALSMDGGFLFYGGRNNKVYIINLQRNELIDSFPTKNTIRSIAVGESEAVFAVGTDDCVMVYDCFQAKVVAEYSLSEIGKTVSCKTLTFVNNILYCGLSNGDIINFEFSKRSE